MPSGLAVGQEPAALELLKQLEAQQAAGRSLSPKELKARLFAPLAAPGSLFGRSVVYFIQSTNGLVKIGTTTQLTARVKDLRAMGATPIELVAAVKGEADLESDLHAEFAASRGHGEWFFPSDEVVGAIRLARCLQRAELKRATK